MPNADGQSNVGETSDTNSQSGTGQSISSDSTEQLDNAYQSSTDVSSSTSELVEQVSNQIDYSEKFVTVNTQLDAINSCLVVLAVLVAMLFGSLSVKFFFDRIRG